MYTINTKVAKTQERQKVDFVICPVCHLDIEHTAGTSVISALFEGFYNKAEITEVPAEC